MCLRGGKRLKRRLPGVLDCRRTRSMHDITIDLEIEGKDELLDFQLCVPLILVSLPSSCSLRVSATLFLDYYKCTEL